MTIIKWQNVNEWMKFFFVINTFICLYRFNRIKFSLNFYAWYSNDSFWILYIQTWKGRKDAKSEGKSKLKLDQTFVSLNHVKCVVNFVFCGRGFVILGIRNNK